MSTLPISMMNDDDLRGTEVGVAHISFGDNDDFRFFALTLLFFLLPINVSNFGQ